MCEGIRQRRKIAEEVQASFFHTMDCIPSNPDVSGIGVRAATYAQTFLSFVPALWALSDRAVSESELDSLETQATTILLTAFALLITALEQAGLRQISNFHAYIVLSLSWMNNTNAFTYFLLYLRYQHERGLECSWHAWWKHIRSKLSVPKGTSSKTGSQSSLPPKRIPRPGLLPLWASLTLRTLFKRVALLLGSVHLSMMAILAIWLWSDSPSFGLATPCATQEASVPIVGKGVLFGSKGLRAVSFVFYALFVLPGLNLIPPIIFFLSLFIGYEKWHQRRSVAQPSANLASHSKNSRMGRCLTSFYEWLHPPSSPSMVPIVFGLFLLFAIDVVFVIDTELTLRRNRGIETPGDTSWTFGQVLPVLLIVMPMRDILEGVLERDEKRRRMQHTVSLRNAIRDGAAETTIHDLVIQGADLNVNAGPDSKWVTALQLAAAHGYEDLVTLLINQKAQVDVLGGEDGTILHAALRGPYQNILKLVLEANADPNVLDHQHGTALQYAASNGHLDSVQLLLSHKADPDIRGGKYETALHAAVYGEHLDVMKVLLARNANPNIVAGTDATISRDYGTTLQIAAFRKRLDMIQILLKEKADPDITGGDYGTVLQFAAYHGNRQIVTLLLEHKAKPNIPAGKYGTALQAAVYQGSQYIVELLLDSEADPNIEAGYYGTALQAACYRGKLRMVKFLLEKHANPKIRGGNFESTLQAAAASEEPEALKVARLLLDKGVDPNVQGGAYGTALHVASSYGNVDVVKLLIDGGADPRTKDKDGKTALDIALEKPFDHVVNILRTAEAHWATRDN
ncbi:ankyrin repeat-containing domain protein [Mycena sanguinolenta]|nr:ankyrin repeat-containing domain protein [Mycena sanguinolenta]